MASYEVEDGLAAEAAAARVVRRTPEIEGLVALATQGRLIRHCARGVQFFADPMNEVIKGVGAHLWFAARALIDFIAPGGQGAILPGSRVCELGAGLGAVGLVLHALSDCKVTLTDLPHVLPLLDFNAAYVACVCPVREPARVAALRWGSSQDLAGLAHEHFDVLLGADIAYEDEQHLPLLMTLEALADGPRTRVLLALADRDDGTLRSFLLLAASRGWRIEPIVLAHRGDEGETIVANPVVVLEGRAPALAISA